MALWYQGNDTLGSTVFILGMPLMDLVVVFVFYDHEFTASISAIVGILCSALMHDDTPQRCSIIALFGLDGGIRDVGWNENKMAKP